MAQPGLRGAPGIAARRELRAGILKVEPGGEMVAAAGEEDGAHLGVGCELAEGLADRAEEVAVHRVELALAGQLDMGHAAFVRDRDPFAFHCRASPPNSAS